jgi:3-oxoacyl-[acyl-carrier protein] reductase
MDLTNKNAIVTGGSIGIGCSIVPALAKAGANVALNYRRHADEANAVVADVEKLGSKGLAVQADVSNFDDAQGMVKQVVETFGSVDILVCNAGINRDGVIWKMTEDQWDDVMQVNLKGYFNYIRAVAPYFREQKHGRIINITSINGMRGKFGQSNYAASKAGIIGLTKTVARELGKAQVTVNAIAPGMIMTEMAKKLDQKWLDIATAETALNKLGDPDDVSDLVVFLASDRAGHITGQVISVDGGQYM